MAERMTTSENITQSSAPQRQRQPAHEEPAQQVAPTQSNWREHVASMRSYARQLGLAGHNLPNSVEMADVMSHTSMVELALNALEAAEAAREQAARLAAEQADAAQAASATAASAKEKD